MSYILDALRKSESERQQQNVPGFADIPVSGRKKSPPVWIWLLAALLLVNAAVLALLLIDNDAASGNRLEVVTLPAAGADPEPSFRDIVNAAREELPAVASNSPPPPANNAETENLTPATTATNSPPATTAVAPPPSATTAEASTRSPSVLPSLFELRANGVLQLPDLHLDIHVYSENPADRFVFINMHKYREQERLAEGPLIKEIRNDGVLLEHRGHDFMLPRE